MGRKTRALIYAVYASDHGVLIQKNGSGVRQLCNLNSTRRQEEIIYLNWIQMVLVQAVHNLGSQEMVRDEETNAGFNLCLGVFVEGRWRLIPDWQSARNAWTNRFSIALRVESNNIRCCRQSSEGTGRSFIKFWL